MLEPDFSRSAAHAMERLPPRLLTPVVAAIKSLLESDGHSPRAQTIPGAPEKILRTTDPLGQSSLSIVFRVDDDAKLLKIVLVRLEDAGANP
ncbi:hypothetical protein [Azospirillum rugosum]|uniref:mRNA-degrading endonuclease RelE, toxin component of the RelBE toxin-antitoxin system n=1 Tax=Azospirillum rugosum TaxID=416170 RepID=A0ABS4SZ28_9PROT|nr:hypothetical protein [Azospirillum rugosum]MBP2296650.1 hypothetical protein [Azospirillum rugosum]MDQ0530291.1 hypothetical protein [Azospirillum rugosum]